MNGYPFGFQQGLDLKTFNAYTIILENVNNFLKKIDPLFVDIPLSFRDWEDRVKMAILTYAAYYEAFFGPGRQFVGGGADTVTLHWPQE